MAYLLRVFININILIISILYIDCLKKTIWLKRKLSINFYVPGSALARSGMYLFSDWSVYESQIQGQSLEQSVHEHIYSLGYDTDLPINPICCKL